MLFILLFNAFYSLFRIDRDLKIYIFKWNIIVSKGSGTTAIVLRILYKVTLPVPIKNGSFSSPWNLASPGTTLVNKRWGKWHCTRAVIGFVLFCFVFFCRLFFRAVLCSQQNWTESTEMSHVYLPRNTCTASLITNSHHQTGTFVTDRQWTYTNTVFSPRVIIYISIQAWCCIFKIFLFSIYFLKVSIMNQNKTKFKIIW